MFYFYLSYILYICIYTYNILAKVYAKTHHQTPMTYGCRHFIHFKTDATEMEILFLSTLMSLLAQFGSTFSLLKKGCQYFCPYNECTSH